MDSEDFKERRQEQQQRRKERLPLRVAEIMTLENVVKITDYQYRVNGKIDLYPIHSRYHVLNNGARGNYNIKNGKIYAGYYELKTK